MKFLPSLLSGKFGGEGKVNPMIHHVVERYEFETLLAGRSDKNDV